MTAGTEGTVAWDRQRMKRDRLAQVQAEMRRQGIAGLYAGDGVHVHYLMDLAGPGVKLFVPAEGEVTVFARPRDKGYVQREHDRAVQAAHQALPELQGSTQGPSRSLASTLRDLMVRDGIGGDRLGVDLLQPRNLLQLIEAGLNVVDAELVWERAWSVKTQDEIAMYRAIGQQYVRAFELFRDAVGPGMTELELAALMTSHWSQGNGEEIAQLEVCAAENMNPWRHEPTERPLGDGEFVGITFQAHGICALRGDASTTFFVGDHPTAEQRDLYRQAYDYLQAAIPVLRAGRPIAEIMLEQPSIPDRYRAQQFNYDLAHGIGMGPPGYPHLDPRSPPVDDVLRPGQVLTVDCYFGEDGSAIAAKFAQQVVVRDGEPEIIGSIPVDDRLLG